MLTLLVKFHIDHLASAAQGPCARTCTDAVRPHPRTFAGVRTMTRSRSTNLIVHINLVPSMPILPTKLFQVDAARVAPSTCIPSSRCSKTYGLRSSTPRSSQHPGSHHGPGAKTLKFKKQTSLCITPLASTSSSSCLALPRGKPNSSSASRSHNRRKPR